MRVRPSNESLASLGDALASSFVPQVHCLNIIHLVMSQVPEEMDYNCWTRQFPSLKNLEDSNLYKPARCPPMSKCSGPGNSGIPPTNIHIIHTEYGCHPENSFWKIEHS